MPGCVHRVQCTLKLGQHSMFSGERSCTLHTCMERKYVQTCIYLYAGEVSMYLHSA